MRIDSIKKIDDASTPFCILSRMIFLSLPIRKIVLFSLLFAAVASLQADPPPRLSEVLSDFKNQIRRVELPNGLKLIMMKRAYAPTVACYIKYRSGAADETDESSGIAHMLEHMLFKGTRLVGARNYESERKYLEMVNLWARRLDSWRRAEETAQTEAEKKNAHEQVEKWKRRLDMMNEMARQFMVPDESAYLYARSGEKGYNAYTSSDLTNYQVELPSNRLEVWARLESDRMVNSVLRDFYTERNVVAEERRMRTDNVGSSLLLEKFLGQAYGNHPYGRPVIGPMRSIQYLNFEQAYSFYREHYSPNNTVIALVGDIDFDETEAMVRKYFGPIERRTGQPHSIPGTNPEAAKGFHIELQKPGSPVQYLAWFKPPMPDPADLHLDIAARILSVGRDSRLFRKLIVQDRIASEIDIYNGYPGERATNLFFVSAVPAPGKTYDAVESAIMNEIKRLRDEGITQAELDRARKNMQAEFIYSIRSNATLAERLSYYESMTGNFQTLFNLYSLLENVTVQDIQNTVKRYLIPDTVMSGRLMPAEAGK